MLTSGLLAARSITERIAALSDCGTANSWRVSTLATAFMGNSLRMNCRRARTPEGGQAPDRAPAGKGDSWVACRDCDDHEHDEHQEREGREYRLDRMAHRAEQIGRAHV